MIMHLPLVKICCCSLKYLAFGVRYIFILKKIKTKHISLSNLLQFTNMQKVS